MAPAVNIAADIHLKARNIEVAKNDAAVFIGLESGQIRVPNLMRDHVRQEKSADVFDQNSFGVLV